MVRAVVALAGLMVAAPAAAAEAAPPSCPPIEFTLMSGGEVAFQPPECTDRDGKSFEVTSVTQPAHGTSGFGPLRYRPNTGYHGFDEFTYRVTDADGEVSVPATVRVLMDTPPSCDDASITAVSGQPFIADLPCDDFDDDLLTIYLDEPAHGTISFPGDGSVIYTPRARYVGPDSFTYYATEDEFGVDSPFDATMSITVVAAPGVTPRPIQVIRPPIAAPNLPADVAAPVISLKNASTKQAVSITLSTSEHATARLKLTLDKVTARRLGLSRRTVGTLKAALTPGSETLPVKLSATARKAFRKLKRVKLTLTAVVTDTAGNQTTKTLALTLKR